MTRRGRRFRLAGVLLGLGLSVAACAGLGRVDVQEARTGERVVRVKSTMTFDQLAKEIWGDGLRGPELARLARLPYERPVPKGTLLVVPGAGPATVREADRFYDEGVTAASTKDYEAAVAAFQACLKRAPDRVDAKYNLGLAQAELGQLDEAVAALEDVVRIRPDHAESRYALGSVLHKRKSYDRALSEFETALEKDPGLAKAAFAAARTLEDLGDDAAARAAWERFLDRFPHDRLAGAAANRLTALQPGGKGGGKSGGKGGGDSTGDGKNAKGSSRR